MSGVTPQDQLKAQNKRRNLARRYSLEKLAAELTRQGHEIKKQSIADLEGTIKRIKKERAEKEKQLSLLQRPVPTPQNTQQKKQQPEVGDAQVKEYHRVLSRWLKTLIPTAQSELIYAGHKQGYSSSRVALLQDLAAKILTISAQALANGLRDASAALRDGNCDNLKKDLPSEYHEILDKVFEEAMQEEKEHDASAGGHESDQSGDDDASSPAALKLAMAKRSLQVAADNNLSPDEAETLTDVITDCCDTLEHQAALDPSASDQDDDNDKGKDFNGGNYDSPPAYQEPSALSAEPGDADENPQGPSSSAGEDGGQEDSPSSYDDDTKQHGDPSASKDANGHDNNMPKPSAPPAEPGDLDESPQGPSSSGGDKASAQHSNESPQGPQGREQAQGPSPSSSSSSPNSPQGPQGGEQTQGPSPSPTSSGGDNKQKGEHRQTQEWRQQGANNRPSLEGKYKDGGSHSSSNAPSANNSSSGADSGGGSSAPSPAPSAPGGP